MNIRSKFDAEAIVNRLVSALAVGLLKTTPKIDDIEIRFLDNDDRSQGLTAFVSGVRLIGHPYHEE